MASLEIDGRKLDPVAEGTPSRNQADEGYGLMLYDDFNPPLDRLCLAFEKNMRGPLIDAMFQELGSYRARDWADAVTVLIHDPLRRVFPRIGECMGALIRVAEDRLEREATETRIREANETRAFFATPAGDTMRTQNRRKARKIITTLLIHDRADRIRALNALGQDFSRPPGLSHPPANPVCACEAGLVFTTDSHGYSYVARCGGCQLGQGHNRMMPAMDPKTFKVVQQGRPVRVAGPPESSRRR